MNHFVFQNHTRIYFGKGVVGQYHAQLLESYGKNVLLAYGGGSIKKTGVYKDMAELTKIAQSVQTGPGAYCKCTPADVESIFKSCWA